MNRILIFPSIRSVLGALALAIASATLSACSDAVTGPAPANIEARKLLSDSDCPGNPGNQCPQPLTPWLVEASSGSWFNFYVNDICTYQGCSAACWSLLNECAMVMPPTAGPCYLETCGHGGAGGDYFDPDATTPPTPVPPPGDGEGYESWSTWAHNKFIDEAFSGTCDNIRTVLKLASQRVDIERQGSSLGDVTSHGMYHPSGATPTPASAAAFIGNYIDTTIVRAESHAQQGRWRTAMYVLGTALHAIADRESPAHSDEHGLPRPWPTPEGSTSPGHSLIWPFGKENWHDATQPIRQDVIAQFQHAMQRVVSAGSAVGKTVPRCQAHIWWSGP